MITDILTAICLVLVIEGIVPFLSPGGYKQALRSMLDLDDDRLRIIALSSMLVGVLLLTFIH